MQSQAFRLHIFLGEKIWGETLTYNTATLFIREREVMSSEAANSRRNNSPRCCWKVQDQWWPRQSQLSCYHPRCNLFPGPAVMPYCIHDGSDSDFSQYLHHWFSQCLHHCVRPRLWLICQSSTQQTYHSTRTISIYHNYNDWSSICSCSDVVAIHMHIHILTYRGCPSWCRIQQIARRTRSGVSRCPRTCFDNTKVSRVKSTMLRIYSWKLRLSHAFCLCRSL